MLRLKKYGIVVALALMAILALAGCSTAPTAPISETTRPKPAAATSSAPVAKAPAGYQFVVINEAGIKPAAVTVPLNTKVIWTNKGKKNHDVTFDAGPSSGTIEPGKTTGHMFSQSGSFAYHDSMNPSQKGIVTVSAK